MDELESLGHTEARREKHLWPSSRHGSVSRSGEGAGTNCIPLCLDRSVETTNKQWGGVCFYIRNGPLTLWLLVRSSRDIELLTVSLRRFYLPCEFRQMCFTIIYIHLCDDASVASLLIADVAQRLDTICPDAQKCVIFDFKHLKLNICDKSLPLPSLRSPYHSSVYLLHPYSSWRLPCEV